MSRWRNGPVDDWPTPREITFTAWGTKHLSADDDENTTTPLTGVMINNVPENDLQALMETAPGDVPAESRSALYALREPLQDAVDALDDRSHWVFDAHVNRGLSFEDIADELSVGKSTAHRLYWESVRMLREHLQDSVLVQERLQSRVRHD